MTSSSCRILRLQVENFMRVVAVDISPEGYLIPITGKNAEGKSSIINAIWAALQWRSASGSIPEPVRRGQEKASVKIDLGDLIITRTWKPGDSKLQVTTRDGAKYSSPQSVLDKLVSEIGYDPLAFVRMQPRDQRTTLMKLLKIDFSQLDKERQELLLEKHYAGNQLRAIETQISVLPPVPVETPDEEVSASDLLNEINEGQQSINQHNNQKYQRDALKAEIDLNNEKIKALEDEIIRLKSRQDEAGFIYQRVSEIIDSFEIPNLIPLQEQLSSIEETNRQVRIKQQSKKLNALLVTQVTSLKQIDEDIECIDQDKKDTLAAAKFPVTGMSFDESGILLNGISFSQASTAEQIRVSLAMGISMNPNLKVLLIRDGNALDSDSLRIVEEMAIEHEMQIWMERVDESGSMGIVIEDGTVKGTRQAVLQGVEA